MAVEDEVWGRPSDECEALYRAAICCAGLLSLALMVGCLLCVCIQYDERERDMDQVLSSSSSSIATPPRGSWSNMTPYRFLRSGVLSCLGCLERPMGRMGCWGMGLLIW